MTLPTLAAEPIFHIGNFSVTNALINSTVVMLIFVILALITQYFLRKHNPKKAPRGFLNFLEATTDFLLGYMDKVTNDRKKSIKFLPIIGGLFLFILISNWLGILPGVGSIGIWENHNGSNIFVPLFRSANSDLNLTLAMAVIAITFSHLAGFLALGFFTYANKFIKLGDLWNALKTLNPIKVLIAFIEFFVGLIEIFSEFAKIVSLSLRLFGNIFAGEVLLTVMASLIAFVVPVPFLGLELLVGLIQALVFSMLTLAYLVVSTAQPHGHEEEHTHSKVIEVAHT